MAVAGLYDRPSESGYAKAEEGSQQASGEDSNKEELDEGRAFVW